MTTTYTYSKASDFGGSIIPHRLEQEINDDVGIAPVVSYISTSGDVVDIVFPSTLSGAEITALNAVIAAHDSTPDPIVVIATSGSTNNTTTTINTTQTTNRTVFIPDVDDTLVAESNVQTLSSKDLVDSSTNIVDNVDATKKLNFSVGGASSGSIMTFSSNHTGNRTVTIPDASTNLVGTDISQTLTNKTLDATSNVISATKLHSATTAVDVSTATAPSSGQVLTATSGTVATWQTPAVVGVITNYEVSVSTVTSTTSTSYVIMSGMVHTPPAGTYLVTLSGSGHWTVSLSICLYAMFIDSTLVAHTERKHGGRDRDIDIALHTQAVLVLNGSQQVNIKYLAPATGVSFVINERSLILLKLA